MNSVVIVGAGHAGFNAANALRQGKYTGEIALIDDDMGLPYQRPPLSKGFLNDKIDRDGLAFRPASFLEENRIDLYHGHAVQISRQDKSVHLADGRRLCYDHLVLASGASNRDLPVEGVGSDSVMVLRTIGDAETIKKGLTTASSVVVIGGGFIGLEVASTARQLGKTVTVLEAEDRIMRRVLSAEMSEAFLRIHRENGTRIKTGSCARRIVTEASAVRAVETEGGEVIEADMVVLGVGVVANDGLGREAGLQVENGIVVDERLRTSDPDIYAIGDCASFPEQSLGRHIRLESVQNATDQARAVAAAIMGKGVPYAAVPWFWSDQYGVKLQIAGLSVDCDRTFETLSRGSGKGSVLCFREGRLVAVESMNSPADHMVARRILASGRQLLADDVSSEFDLVSWEAADRAVAASAVSAATP